MDLYVFQVWPFRTQIDNTQLGLLKIADHIAWHRPYVIWHHAIVAGIDVARNLLETIHYTKNAVVKQCIKAEELRSNCFRFDYPRCITYPPEVVIQRAESRIGERRYDLLRNNCEHFATSCKTGIADSIQIQWLYKKLKETAQAGITNCSKESAKTIGKIVVNYMGKVAVSETIERFVRGTNNVGFVIVGVIEVLHCISDIYKMSKEMNVGDTVFKVTATQRVAECVVGAGLCMLTSVVGEKVGSVVGQSLFGMVGGYLGSIVPIIGTSVGATVGAAAGQYIGEFAGSVIGGVVGSLIGKPLGSILGRYIGNMLSR